MYIKKKIVDSSESKMIDTNRRTNGRRNKKSDIRKRGNNMLMNLEDILDNIHNMLNINLQRLINMKVNRSRLDMKTNQ